MGPVVARVCRMLRRLRAGRGSARWWAITAFVLFSAIYALSAGGHTYSSDEEGMFEATASMVDRQSSVLVVTDDNEGIVPVVAGRSGAPTGVSGIGNSVVAAPFYVAGEAFARLVAPSSRGVVLRVFVDFVNAPVTALGVALVVLLGVELGASPRSSAGVAFVYAAGTWAWPHAKTFFSEPLTALGLLAAALALLRADRSDRARAWLLTGFFLGSALLARSTAALAGPAFVAFVLSAWWASDRRPGPLLRRASLACAGAVPPVLLLGAVNWWRYGSPTDLGYQSVPLNFPFREGVYGLVLSPGKSMFLYAPVIVIGLWAAVRAPTEQRPKIAFMLLIALAHIAFFARFIAWHGDHTWGPRYLTPALPFMVLPCAAVVASVRWRRAVAVAGASGALISMLGVVMYFNQYFAIVEHSEPLRFDAGGPHYWKRMHYQPRWSPLVGHVLALPTVIDQTFRRMDGSDRDLQPFPTTARGRYGWYFAPPQLDAWWYWIGPEHGARRLYVLLLPQVGALAWGAARLRRGILL